MEGDFLLDRLDGGSHDNDLELQRQSPPAASSSALRSCYMAISQPPVVLCLDAALAVVSLTLVGFKLDNLPFAPSWVVALLPLTLGAVLSLLFLLSRLVVTIKGVRLRDHLDSKARLVFWLLTDVMVLLTALQLVVAGPGSDWPAIFVLAPLLAWCTGCMIALFWVLLHAQDAKERVMAVCGQVVLALLGLTLLLVAMRIDGQLAGWSWATVLAPFFVLCGVPVVAPILGCVGVRVASQPSCGHVWDFQRPDASEAVVFGTAGAMLAALLLPSLISVVLLLPKMEGIDAARLYTVALLPLLLQLFVVFVLSFLGLIRAVASCALSWRRHVAHQQHEQLPQQ